MGVHMIKVEQDEVMEKGVGVAARVASHRDNDWLRWLVRFANIKEDEFMLTSIKYTISIPYKNLLLFVLLQSPIARTFVRVTSRFHSATRRLH